MIVNLIFSNFWERYYRYTGTVQYVQYVLALQSTSANILYPAVLIAQACCYNYFITAYSRTLCSVLKVIKLNFFVFSNEMKI